MQTRLRHFRSKIKEVRKKKIGVVQFGVNPIPEIAVIRNKTPEARNTPKSQSSLPRPILYLTKITKPTLNEHHYSQNIMLAVPKSYLAGPLGPTSECGIRSEACAAEGTWWYNATLGNVTIWLQASNNSANHPTSPNTQPHSSEDCTYKTRVRVVLASKVSHRN